MEEIASSVLNTGTQSRNLVEVKYQKNNYRSQKYLEAEPKALGVTQIVLGLFVLSVVFSIPSTPYFDTILNSISSWTSIIAGGVAIAAHNLHPSRLKVCLGMQIVVCVASAISFLNKLGEMGIYPDFNTCWEEQLNSTYATEMCERLWSIAEHITGIGMLVQATMIALSATLAAFCCKVIQCCSPRSNVPVIVVNSPTRSQ